MTLDEIERQVIYAAFRYHRENKSATAAALGVSPRTLDNKFERYAAEAAAAKAAADERQRASEAFLRRQRGEVEAEPVAPTTVADAMTPSAALAAPAAPSPAVLKAPQAVGGVTMAPPRRPALEDVLGQPARGRR